LIRETKEPSDTPSHGHTLAATFWDDRVRQLGGHLLQSWRWGEFKERHGWRVERIATSNGGETALAQVLFKQRGPASIGYLPRGPVLPPGNEALARILFAEIDRVCRKHRALHLIVEPDVPLPFRGTFKEAGFVRGPAPFQPGRTVKVPLLDDEDLLAQMHQKTRYNVRLAQRRGVKFRRGSLDEIGKFYDLMVDTSHRNRFGIHQQQYYADFLRIFGDDAALLCACVEGGLAAAVIVARFGTEAIYMFGASSTERRANGASFYLQFEAMRWAREAGCRWYDLWGIPLEDPPTTSVDGDRVAGTHGDDWRGLYRFKVGFGGEIVTYPMSLERRYAPLLSFAARNVYGNRI
jgi:lipid II:glycine glycyltransferase (peptidoglycan interpeptide bridge formation enzyme)